MGYQISPTPLQIAATNLTRVKLYAAGDTIYYSPSSTVSSTTYEGTLTPGQILELSTTKYFVTARDKGGGFPGSGHLTPVPVRFDRLLDARETGLNQYDSTGSVNVTALQAALDIAVAQKMYGVYVPEGTFYLNSVVRLPPNVTLRGAGRDLTVFKVHPDYASNGPIVANKLDDNADVLPVSNSTIEDMTFDGDYTSNTDYNTRCNAVGDQLSTATTILVDDTTGFDASGRVSLVDTGDNVSRATYTSKDATHFYGWVWDDDQDHDPANIADGTELRKFNTSTTGLVRFYAYENLVIRRVTFQYPNSYCFAAEGRPYDTDESHRGPKTDLLLEDVHVLNSYSSDGIDIKDQEHLLALHCRAEDCGDKGFNVRGRSQTWVNCVSKRNRTGFGLTASPAVTGTARISLGLQSTITTASTTLTFTSSALLQVGDYGWIGGTEYVQVTGKPTGTTATVTRGLGGTRPAPHLSTTKFVVDWVVDDLEDTIGAIDMFGCHSDGDTTGFALNAGGSYTRASVHGGTIKNCTLGMQLISVLGPMEADVHGTRVYNNQTGIKATKCVEVGFYGVKVQGCTGNGDLDPGTNSDGDAITLDDCSNGAELHGCILSGNAGNGMRALGTTNWIHCEGRPPYSNGLRPWNFQANAVNITGSWFGRPDSDFIPTALQETIPLREAKDELTMVSGTVYAAPIIAKGMFGATVLTTYVTGGTSVSPTSAKFALLELSGTNGLAFTKLTQIDPAFTIFTTTGFKNALTLVDGARYWLTPGKKYALAILWEGTGTAPKIAALAPVRGETSSTYRTFTAGTVASSSADVPSSGTLTATTTIPYLGIANNG